MTTIKEPTTGHFPVELELANHADQIRAEIGLILPEKVRRARIRGIVHTGRMRMVIPDSVALQLGLETSGNAKVRYVDGRTEERAMVKNVHLACGGRDGVFTAIVGPESEWAIIGVIVLDDLDFLVDCVGQQLVPRDPKQIVSEIE